MPRPNIPYRSMRHHFSNRKHATFARSQTTDNPEGQSCHVNNILVFPKNSETTINVVSNNNRSCPYGNLLKKIKGRKRKEKQRLKKKQSSGVDVKPVINKVKSSEKMEAKLNKHIIFLSDSENENDKPNDSSISDINTRENCGDDDDVIFIETPPAEVIEIDDSTEQNESSERDLEKSEDPENSSDANDFLDNAHMNSKNEFNFELHGSEFKGAEFLKPSTKPMDMSESGSVSSVSDVSTPIPMNVFNVIDFPQDNLFDDNNLEKFRNAITPQRSNKKLKNAPKGDEFATPESRGNQKNLPTLSEIQGETDVRKQRGRSIIKELVNDRAYVLLSTAQKKNKNKKRKTKDELSDTFEEENTVDSQELNRKKKKKKSKKQESLVSTELNDETTETINMVDDGKNKKPKSRNEDNADESSINVRTDLFDSPSPFNKKSKKNRQEDFAGNEENGYKKKRKLRKSSENPSNESGTDSCDEKKRKKSKRTSETVAEQNEIKLKNSQPVEETIEEKKRKKTKKYDEMEEVEIVQHEYKASENKKEKEKELDDEHASEKKKKSKKYISNYRPEEEMMKNTAGILQKQHDPLENSKEKECDEQTSEKKKKLKKNTSTDVSEGEVRKTVAETTQKIHEPLENKKDGEKDNADEQIGEKKKRSKKNISTDLSEDEAKKNVTETTQKIHEPSEDKKDGEKDNADEQIGEKKKRSKKNISTDLSEDEAKKNVTETTQKVHKPLEYRKEEEKEIGQEHIGEKKKSMKNVSTDVPKEEPKINVTEVTQKLHDQVENRKEEEEENSDEKKKKLSKCISTDEVLKNVAEIPQKEHGTLENRKEKVNEYITETKSKYEALKNVVDISLKDHEKAEKKQEEADNSNNFTIEESKFTNDLKTEKPFNINENKNDEKVSMEEEKDVEEQVSSAKSHATTVEEEASGDMAIKNIAYHDSGKDEPLVLCQSTEPKKNKQEFEMSVEERIKRKLKKGVDELSEDVGKKNEDNEVLLVIEEDKAKIKKRDRRTSEISDIMTENTQTDLANNEERRKKKFKKNVEAETSEPKRINLNEEETTNIPAGVSQSQNDKELLMKEEMKKEIDNDPSVANYMNSESMEVYEIINEVEHTVNTSNNIEELSETEKLTVSSDNPVNCNEEPVNNSETSYLEGGGKLDPMVVVDTEGNVDMKLTGVFSTAKSIFPDANNFSIDVDVDNFSDKLNAPWKTQPSKFYSYNGPLFKDATIQELPEKTKESSSGESTTEVITTPFELHNTPTDLSSGSIVPTNTEETVLVKQESDSSKESENDPEVILEVVVKKEKESEPKAEENTSEPPHPSENCRVELPDEIEEIFKEKENHDTVKRLCEFLEEVRDPKDVLKKVSLLKQAFKAQDSKRTNEEVEIIEDKDDVLSISSSGSSVMCLEDDVSVVSINDDITLANCDIARDEIPGRSNDTSVQQNDVIEIVECTSQPMSTSRTKPRESPREEKGLDKYEVEDIQGCMKDDPKLWKIVAEDQCPVKLPTKGKRCIKCREIGHLGYNCPNKLNLPKCSLCGMEGHLDFKCPNRICTQCGRRTPMMQNCCDHCKHYRNVTCVLCKNKGHPRYKCPDLWRRYHLTVKHGPLVQREPLKLKDRRRLWCSSCAKSGHVESECEVSWRKFKHFQPLDPRVHHYVDVYNAQPTDYIQPNIEEVAQTSPLFPNVDSSSSSSSSISSNQTPEEKRNVSITSSPRTADDSLVDLPPEFEVIDEVLEENQETVVCSENQQCYETFMTCNVESLKQFLRTELSLLETTKFDIRNLFPRFIAFQEDDKRHKFKFPVSRKRQFYKQLNMLLFGRLQVKCGKIHKDKLKHFVDSNVDAVPASTRESLYYSYDYIFRNTLHDHVNYKFFMKMIRDKYGNQRWFF